MSNGYFIEKIKKGDFLLSNLLDKEITNKLNSFDLIPINLIFIKDVQEMRDKKIPPQTLIIGHENDKEIKEKIVHISCSDEKLLKDFMEIIK
ncbi:MAG: hypothetical protein AABZ83_03935 [candidate division NC10 bacterium]